MKEKFLILLILIGIGGCQKDRKPPSDEGREAQSQKEVSSAARSPDKRRSIGAGRSIGTIGSEAAKTFRLASWNIRTFSDGSRDDAELFQICQILAKYDLIAIIELRDKAVLLRIEVMLESMGRNYDYQISPPVGRGVKERYAFLYDANRVNEISTGQLYPDPNDVFIREPFYATFRAGQFDYTAIATHVIWGKRVKARRAEISYLDDVYRAIQDADSTEQDVLLVGDFNRNPDDLKSYASLRAIPSMTHLFSLPQKSHIKETSLYDNIFFQTDYVTEYTGRCGIDRFDETDFANNDKAASLAVSDHRPVWAEFRLDRDDD